MKRKFTITLITLVLISNITQPHEVGAWFEGFETEHQKVYYSPTPTSNNMTWTAIEVEGTRFAVDAEGILWSWGTYFTEHRYEDGARVGGNSGVKRQRTPIRVLDNVVDISANMSRAFAVRADGSLWAWGNNWSGGLGDGTDIQYQTTPIKIMDNVVTVSTGTSHTFVIRTDGSLWGWGGHLLSGLGDGTETWHYTPIKILDDVVAVSAGGSHTLAIRSDRSLWAWGHDGTTHMSVGDGRLGHGSTGNRLSPVKIMENVIATSAGRGHSMAIRNDGSLWAWGNPSYGVLGNGLVSITTWEYSGRNYQSIDTSLDVLSPIRIMDDVIAVSAGGVHTMAIRSDGSLWAWGSNTPGLLGDGTTINRPIPIRVMDNVVSVSAGTQQTMAIISDGSLWIWGGNVYHDGQRELEIIRRLSPVRIEELGLELERQ